jgi:hypothetical protein
MSSSTRPTLPSPISRPATKMGDGNDLNLLLEHAVEDGVGEPMEHQPPSHPGF